MMLPLTPACTMEFPHDDNAPCDSAPCDSARCDRHTPQPLTSAAIPDRILFGAAYYAEYQLSDRLDTDLDLMVEAGFTVIRVGESVWSTWEPRDGEFDLEWLQPVLDGAHARGISVILGTPTYAVPPWLQQSHPEIAAQTTTGEPMPWGSRQEVAEIGAALKQIGTRLDGYEPDADVAILWSTATRFAFDFTPPLNVDGTTGRGDSYQHIVDSFHAGVIGAGAQARILHVAQAVAIGAAELAKRFPVLVAAAVYIADDDELQLLADYAQAGGHLIVGPRTGYADEEARARLAVAPDKLHDAAGVWYEEFTNLDDDLAVTGTDALPLSPEARATDWADGLIVEGADVLATYEHSSFGRFPAVMTRRAGTGRITYVGTVPNGALSADVVRYAVPQPIAAGWTRGDTVTVASGTLPDGAHAWFVHNWSATSATVTVPHDVCDLTGADPARHLAGTEISLEPWSSLALVDG